MADRNASQVLFGFDFQINSAIVIMLENIKEMATIRLEGTEDIEITLNDGSKILAQAKSVVNSSTDFSNVLRNLKKSINSLSEAQQKVGVVKQLIYITNTPNPFNEKTLNSIFYGQAHRDYDSLAQSLKDVIDKITREIVKPLDTSKFLIQILPFETDNNKERYKCVMEAIDSFKSNLCVSSISKENLHTIWQSDIFKNGTKRAQNFVLSKKDIIWPIIVLIIENHESYDELDQSQTVEISRSYNEIINYCTERYEFATRVLRAFQDFQKDKNIQERKQVFIREESKNYLPILKDNNISISDELMIKLIEIILINILNKRIQIDNIKNAVNL